MEPFGTLEKRGVKYVMTEDQVEWMRRYYPVTENSRIMEVTGMKFATLHRIARSLHLTKSEAGMKAIRKRQTKKCLAINRANGYYESLKGIPPSEACIQSARVMWQEIREGKREHPLQIHKKRHPHKYRKLMERKSEERKELIRKERLRARYGMTRQSKLTNVVERSYTRSQRNHRYNALRKGYILSADLSDEGGERYVIYYDATTHRSSRFENQLVKDGFRVREEESE